MIVDLYADEWSWRRNRPGWELRGNRIGELVGSSMSGASLYELPSGSRSFPYHAHYGEEEFLLVLSGRPTLRTPAGERELRAGDAVVFPVGPEGAHQLRNDAEEPARFVVFSTLCDPEVAEFPDSGKIGVFAGHRLEGEREIAMFVSEGGPVDYWAGED